MPRFLAWLALAALPAHAASTFSTDASDLWWNPAESGWGVNILQQANVLFATFFVYSADGRAHWYVASDLEATGAGGTTVVFTGSLFETTGPSVRPSAFDPAAVARRNVGSATVQYTPPNAMVLTYTVDGRSTTKALRRQTWRANDISGSFEAMIRALSSTCEGSGESLDKPGRMNVSQSGNSVTISTVLGALSSQQCTYTGTYTQTGLMGELAGNYTCTSGVAPRSGSFSMTEIEVSKHGFMARLDHSDGRCTSTGRMTAIRATVD